MGSTVIGDFDYEGGVDATGNMKVLSNEEALTQSIKLWLVSRKSDMVGFPEQGGYLFNYLLKPMQETDAGEIASGISISIEEDFSPYLEVVEISVEPNYEERYWKINAVFYFPTINYTLFFNENLKNQI